MFLDGRPPVNVGVTSGGDIFGGTQITFSDVLGDKQFNFFAASISQYRTIAGSLREPVATLPVRAPGLLADRSSSTGSSAASSTIRRFSRFIDRDLALATRTMQGGSAFGDLSVQPVSPRRDVRRRRQLQRALQRPGAGAVLEGLPGAGLRHAAVPQRHGRAARRGLRPGDDGLPRVRAAVGQHDAARRTRSRRRSANTLSRQTFDLDVRSTIAARRQRACWRCAGAGSRAGAMRPTSTTSAATPSCAGTNTSQFTGNNTFFCERRAALPADRGDADADWRAGRRPRRVLRRHRRRLLQRLSRSSSRRNKSKPYTPIIGYQTRCIRQPARRSSGTRSTSPGSGSCDGRASYGFGLETFALGFPIHFDWAWRTLFNRDWEDALFAAVGGSEEFRRPQFKVWIGYDF